MDKLKNNGQINNYMKIIVIKLGALGDVVRTLPIAEALKKKYPNSEISWITKQNALELFEGNPFIDKTYSIPFKLEERFDLLYNFDIEEEATSLALQIKAAKKYGFFSEGGYASSFNLGAEYYLNTVFDDGLKKSNRKTYQEMMFDAAELKYEKEKPKIYLTENNIKYAENFLKKNNITREKLIGIHIGADSRWPSKTWSEEKIKDFIKKTKEKGYEILIFGGPNEMGKIEKLQNELNEKDIKIYINNPHNSIKEFASLVNNCKKMICSDSLSLHVSLALNKSTIGLFFCTTPYEVEDYGLLKKIVSPLYEKFFPEKQDQYDEELVNSISAEEVISYLE